MRLQRLGQDAPATFSDGFWGEVSLPPHLKKPQRGGQPLAQGKRSVVLGQVMEGAWRPEGQRDVDGLPNPQARIFWFSLEGYTASLPMRDSPVSAALQAAIVFRLETPPVGRG